MAAVVLYRAKRPRLIAALLAVIRLPGAVIRRRRLLGQLGDLDERMLRDIGLSRHDVTSAAAEPLFRDPSLMLARRAEDRRVATRAAARERMNLAALIREWVGTDRAA